MGQTKEEHNKNYKEKIYHLQCLIPINRAWYGEPNDIYYRNEGWGRFTGYRTAKQVLDAIKHYRKQNITSWGLPWKFRIKIVK
jgi:hypothetical protein